MRALIGICIVLVAGCGAGQTPADAGEAKRIAQSLAVALSEGDYGTVIDHTYDGIVTTMGGREKAISTTKSVMEMMATQQMSMESYEVGTPGPLHTEGGNTFVVVPTVMRMKSPKGTLVSEGFLLGIHGGGAWKFVSGSGINDRVRERILPKLPADLVLPEVRKRIE